MELKVKNADIWTAIQPLGEGKPSALQAALKWPMSAAGSRNAAKLARQLGDEAKDIDAARVKLCEELCEKTAPETEGGEVKPLTDANGYVFTDAARAEFARRWAELLEAEAVIHGVRPIYDNELGGGSRYEPEVMLIMGPFMAEKPAE